MVGCFARGRVETNSDATPKLLPETTETGSPDALDDTVNGKPPRRHCVSRVAW